MARKDSSRNTTAALAAKRFGSTAMRTIAVTGTSGKTTTAWLTAAVLAEAGLRVGVISDFGYLGPDDRLPFLGNPRRPEAVAAGLARLQASDCTHAVVECSGRMLAAPALSGIRFDTVVVTNLDADRPRSRAAAGRAAEMARRSAAAVAADGCLISGASPAAVAPLRRLLPDTAACLRAGLDAAADVTASSVDRSLFGRTVLATWGGQTMPLALDTPVVPFVRDSLLAIAVGGRYRIPLTTAVRAVESAGAVPGRMERLDRGQETPVFIDTPTSGHALAATLASLRRLTRGRLALIAEEPAITRLGGCFGPLVARHCDACLVTPATVLDDDAGNAELSAYARIDRLLESLGPDDCLLALGGMPGGGRGPRPPAGRFPLAMLVDGWLQLANEPVASLGRRAA
ncbi:MAG: hypothetical protein RLZZ440_2189 [Planctomycetota bacterium]